jgi:hypothetical protein
MTIMRQLGLLWRRKLRETLRQPVWVVVGLSTPLLYLALFAPLLHRLAGGPGFPRGAVLDVFVPGVLCLLAFGAGMGKCTWPDPAAGRQPRRCGDGTAAPAHVARGGAAADGARTRVDAGARAPQPALLRSASGARAIRGDAHELDGDQWVPRPGSPDRDHDHVGNARVPDGNGMTAFGQRLARASSSCACY